MQNTPGLDGDVPAMDLEGNCRLFPWNTGKGIGFPVTCKSCVCAAFMSRDKGEDGRFCSTLQVNGESVYDEEWNGRPTSRPNSIWERYTSFPIDSEREAQIGSSEVFFSLRAEFSYLSKPIYHHQGTVLQPY